MKCIPFCLLLAVLPGLAVAQAPSLEEVISVPSVRSVGISPDGRRAAIVQREADWDANRYVAHIRLWDGTTLVRLRRPTSGSAYAPSWSPDGQRLAYLAHDDGAQVFIHDLESGTAQQATAIVGGVNSFKWSPDGRRLALLLDEPADPKESARQGRYGAFTLADQEQQFQHLWLLDLGHTDESGPAAFGGAGLRRLTGGRDFTVGSFFGGDFNFTPDGSELLFDHARSNRPEDIGTQDISAVHLESGAIRTIVRAPGIDQGPIPSPDGQQIVFHRAPAPPYYFSRQYHLAVAAIGGGKPQLISGDLRHEAALIGWYPDGILLRLHEGVTTRVYRMDPQTRGVTSLTPAAGRIHAASASADGRRIAYVEDDAATAREAYLQQIGEAARRLTDITSTIADWPPHPMRLVQWQTKDGTEIEGILYLPDDGPSEPRPLFVIAHGGPATPSRPERVPSEVYPVPYWLDRGAAVLVPNYRGSGGYGDEFMAMNAGRLAEAYAEDIESGVDHLVMLGIADPDRIGVMGFSAGGEAAAYLATHSDRFRAASVGAGVSDYFIDYMANDQPPKMREYLGDPWQHRDLYARISAISALDTAATPTLIQHGRRDQRVPLVNAMALFRGLRHFGVEAQLVIYENAGHGFPTPRDRLAAMEHNRRWFDAYVFGQGRRPDLSLRGE